MTVEIYKRPLTGQTLYEAFKAAMAYQDIEIQEDWESLEQEDRAAWDAIVAAIKRGDFA